jgi:hypothetical protein
LFKYSFKLIGIIREREREDRESGEAERRQAGILIGY